MKLNLDERVGIAKEFEKWALENSKHTSIECFLIFISEFSVFEIEGNSIKIDIIIENKNKGEGI